MLLHFKRCNFTNTCNKIKLSMNPLNLFNTWYQEELNKSTVPLPSACCLSSIGSDGYPNSRFVSLKEVIDQKFVITGPIKSRKGVELLANPKAALTFWWTATERQVRVQGDAIQIENDLAKTYFSKRSKGAQIVSHISNQGEQTNDFSELVSTFEKEKINTVNSIIDKPKHWSGFYIVPKRIELMTFKKNRLHYRELYVKTNNKWSKFILQP
ncbi:pyridoxal 5'-phosphate synthase [uncultured Psychroserpens sp.]|uniref:pyridoxine/pyridoxamine 5'-phosphate oxidase n=1 Tax=uncultured Psychroserpens sp. TaxID=255436 RepID=UPI00263017AC|nr:pyridoxal 5'-phosphate synthase [uncultured Psychroserpens sp.]